jgi:arylsulfatase A-like enzyme/Flp pilus assembly protein TadD
VARPFRYTFILVLAAVSTVLAAVGGWRYARASAPVSGPVVIISVEALRADHLPAYGYSAVRTPAIDALAADGVLFERAYSHSPQTLPAHASLLSGRLPFETGVRDNAGFAMRDADRLVAEILSDRGYATGAVVSSFALRKATGLDQGFGFFDDQMPSGASGDADRIVERPGSDSEALAEQWLESAGTARAFLFLHLAEPHAPYAASDRFAEFAPYDAEIAYADEIIGRFVKYLKAHQLYDQSTIILVSDHGEGLGDHGEQEHGLFVYDEALRVPLIVKQAAGEGAGRRVATPVQHIDLVPTILDLVKAPVPGNLQGQSLKPLLDGTDTFAARPIYGESLFGRYRFGWSPLTTVTDGRYRYIRAPREELYDLHLDPQQHRNIAGSETGTVAELGKALDRLTLEAALQPPDRVAPEDFERLATLGYVRRVTVASTERTDNADPKDMSGLLETYREALALARLRLWPAAIGLLQTIVDKHPEMVEVWAELASQASLAGRSEQALEAYWKVTTLAPEAAAAYLGGANELVRMRRLDEARRLAEIAATLADDVDEGTRVTAHGMLAAIALTRGDPAAARRAAALVLRESPGLPLYVEARLLYDAGRYQDALSLFERAIDESDRAEAGVGRIAELRFYVGDTFLRLGRPEEAESQWLRELEYFPQNARARAALAMLYHTTDRAEEAAGVVDDLVRLSPTPEGYAVAARLWTSLGNPQKATELRAKARHLPPHRSTAARR